ncbi:leucine-rich repeat domain-containing protein [archaeon]|nr:MAG: leucine-rich repeat domain-containing protein [archaeon]
MINSCSNSLQALDLSHNRIDSLPVAIPSQLIALNLSKNHISELSSPKALFQLVELNLSRNRIRRYVCGCVCAYVCMCM